LRNVFFPSKLELYHAVQTGIEEFERVQKALTYTSRRAGRNETCDARPLEAERSLSSVARCNEIWPSGRAPGKPVEARIDAPGIDRGKLHEYIGNAALKFFDVNPGVQR
jgi:hypothetical protein